MSGHALKGLRGQSFLPLPVPRGCKHPRLWPQLPMDTCMPTFPLHLFWTLGLCLSSPPSRITLTLKTLRATQPPRAFLQQVILTRALLEHGGLWRPAAPCSIHSKRSQSPKARATSQPRATGSSSLPIHLFVFLAELVSRLYNLRMFTLSVVQAS